MAEPTHLSLWVETTPTSGFPGLGEPVSVDVAVVGGGIAGITTALLLKRAGKTVALLDSKRILTGATGYTTAKVTSQHGQIYTHLRKYFGEEGARLYGEAQETAKERIAQLIEEEGIDCDWERRDAYIYADDESQASQLRDEAEAARAAGLPASWVDDVPLPYETAGGVQFTNQAQFHPRKYLLPLAAAVAGDGSHVFEDTRVTGVKRGSPSTVVTTSGELSATDVVIASHLPILDRGLFFAKAHPHRSYAVAARISEADEPPGMYINAGQPTRSVRTSADEQGRLLLLGGAGHKPAHEPHTESRYRELEDFGREHWSSSEFPYQWSTMDFMPVDKVPYIGRLTRGSGHVYVATGFNKWGMTNGTAAALILSDAILGRENAWADLFDAKRLKPRASTGKFVKENAHVGVKFLADRLKPAGGPKSPAELEPGEGALMRVRGRRTAVYRDDSGELHGLSPVCQHLKCIVAWNPAERSWDCPCHGSRYAGDGTVIVGPTTKDLRKRNL